MENFTRGITVLLVVFALGFVLGGLIGISASMEIRSNAIEANCAYYHPQTGEFTWKETL